LLCELSLGAVYLSRVQRRSSLMVRRSVALLVYLLLCLTVRLILFLIPAQIISNEEIRVCMSQRVNLLDKINFRRVAKVLSVRLARICMGKLVTMIFWL